jgi:hypothetical protein
MAQRAADRCGETVEVLIEEQLGPGRYQGRAAHQAPEVDGVTTVRSPAPLAVGDMVGAVVVESEGVDLIAEARLTAPVRGIGTGGDAVTMRGAGHRVRRSAGDREG